MSYQPTTGAKCSCKRGQQRDNCPNCEGTGMVIDFAVIRARNQDPKQCLAVIARKVGEHLLEEGLKVFEKLTEDEKQSFGGTGPYYLAKLITCCVVDTVESQFAAESMKPLMKNINKIRSTRP